MYDCSFIFISIKSAGFCVFISFWKQFFSQSVGIFHGIKVKNGSKNIWESSFITYHQKSRLGGTQKSLMTFNTHFIFSSQDMIPSKGQCRSTCHIHTTVLSIHASCRNVNKNWASHNNLNLNVSSILTLDSQSNRQ